MRALTVGVAVLLGGCNQILGIGDVTLGGVDAPPPIDGSTAPDAFTPCPGWTYTISNVPCSVDSGGISLDVTVNIGFDTDTGAVTAGTTPMSLLVDQISTGPQVRVMVVDSLTIEPGKLLH